jgi:spire-like protein
MHLREVLELVDRPLSQEQAWAILYQCSSLLKRIWRQRQRDGQPIFPVELEFVCLAGDGSIDVQWQGKKENGLVAATKRNEIIASIGWTVYRGLDYGLAEDEERELEDELEQLIICMTDNIPEDQKEEDTDFDTIIEACKARLPLSEETDNHYKSVCRSLVNRAKKKSLKLRKDIHLAETYELQGKISAYDSLPDVVPNEWMVHWMHIVDQLKQGVKLQEVGPPEDIVKRKYELTPYEKLMESIKHPPQLNSALELEQMTEDEKRKRSHPHLKPSSRRILPVKRAALLTPMEQLMQEIQSPPVLKKVAIRIQSEPFLDDLSQLERPLTPSMRSQSSPSVGRSPVTRRRLKARTLVELFYEAETTKDTETASVDSSVKSHGSTVTSAIKTDIKSTENKRSAVGSEECRGTPNLLGDTNTLKNSHQLSMPVVPSETTEQTSYKRKLDLSPSLKLKLDEDKANKKPVITLNELRHIREVLDRALMESLEAEEEALCEALKAGKVCSSCHNTRFSFFDRNRTCAVCIKRVCSKCLSKVPPLDAIHKRHNSF